MIRLVHAPKERLTPFDLKDQIFRVSVELSVYYRGQKFFPKKCPKVTFWLERKFFRSFFWNSPLWTTDDRQNIKKKNFRAVRVLLVIFSNIFFSISVAKMGIKRLRLDYWWSSIYPKNFAEPIFLKSTHFWMLLNGKTSFCWIFKLMKLTRS